jgi:hypothetical protein
MVNAKHRLYHRATPPARNVAFEIRQQERLLLRR